jgi:hypothetical protein
MGPDSRAVSSEIFESFLQTSMIRDDHWMGTGWATRARAHVIAARSSYPGLTNAAKGCSETAYSTRL